MKVFLISSFFVCAHLFVWGDQIKNDSDSIKRLHTVLLSANSMQVTGTLIAWDQSDESKRRISAITTSPKVMGKFAEWLIDEPWQRLNYKPDNFASATLVKITLVHEKISSHFLIYAGCISFEGEIYEQKQDYNISVGKFLRELLNNNKADWNFAVNPRANQ
ncbi:MAG: hypothetical protein ABL974_18925 [Prosthecobacter sp.]